jgi:NitT/TauT family transport system substrate-binding protein
VLEKAGLKPTDAELVKTGGFGEGVVALDLGARRHHADPRAAVVEEQGQVSRRGRASDVLPPLDNVVGVTTGKAAAKRAAISSAR